MSPIEKTAEELNRVGIINGDDIRLASSTIKRQLLSELEGHVSTMTKEQAQGWQKCLLFLGLNDSRK